MEECGVKIGKKRRSKWKFVSFKMEKRDAQNGNLPDCVFRYCPEYGMAAPLCPALIRRHVR